MTYNVFGGTLNPTLSIYLVSLYYSSLMLQIRMELKPPWQSFELYECFFIQKLPLCYIFSRGTTASYFLL